MGGTKTKKGLSGNAAQYITRTRALRKLQLSLAQFRKLCIVKGIHPREPKKKTQGNNKTYYHIKDILFLAHEPLIQKYREVAIHQRKIRKARAKRNEDLARRLQARQPSYKLDHLVKERYPSFIDALRDLDDALTMIHLFATLPAEQKFRIPNFAVHTSRRLALEWQAFIVRTGSLRKVFISVKGFYFQAEVLGQTITWLVPHQLSQVLPQDVDYRVMVTFVEFYQTLLQFVNFKLYHTIGVSYPPVVDPKMEQAAAGIASIMQEMYESQNPKPSTAPKEKEPALDSAAMKRLEGLQDKLHDLQQLEVANLAEADKRAEEAGQAPQQASGSAQPGVERDSSDDSDSDDDAETEADTTEDALKERRESHAHTGSLGDDVSAAAQGLVGGAIDAQDDADVCASLFKGMVFFLGREVPREQLLLVIRSFGGQVGWDGEESPIKETDPSITNQVVDRPKVVKKHTSRAYVQPQWIVDSANFRVLADAELYGPGKNPPPHLSPFVELDEEDEYIPEYFTTMQRMQASATALRQRAAGIAVDVAFLEDKPLDDSAKTPEEEALAEERLYATQLAKELKQKRGAELEEDDEDMAEEDAPASKKAKLGENPNASDVIDADKIAMNKASMKRKDRNLYQSILNRQAAKRQKVTKLQQRKQALAGSK